MKRTFISCLFALTTLCLWAQYNPTNPPEPGQYYTLTLQITPSGGGTLNLNTTTSQQGGNFVRLRANSASGFQFVAWAENGVILSQDVQFDYQMPNRNVTLTAHFDYTPTNPSEPSTPDIPLYSRVYASCSPVEGGNYHGVTSGNRYQQGTSLSLYTSTSSNFQFDYWTENGEIISTASSFKYVVKSFDAQLVAHFLYNPTNPGEPPLLQPTHKLYLSASPSGAGSFSQSSGLNYQPGTAVTLSTTAKSGYTFSHWTENDSIIASSASITYTMPNHDVALQAHFSQNPYNPTNPAEPGAPSGERHNIFGMTENALRGETILYPVWLENSTQVMNMYIDLTFPDGFFVDTAGALLSSRVGNHWLEKIWLEGNTWRMRVRGQDVLMGNNGQVFEIPVTIPEDAQMGHNYLVALTHGVVMRPDSTQVPIGVRSGNIYVQRLFEDELFASFTYDKYQKRVGFRNRSAGHIQSFEWDFGDGQHSTEYNPVHTYASPGTYTVRLTVQGESEQDVMETTIVLNESSSWKVEGTFYIDTTQVSARNFSSLDELIPTLLQAEITGNVIVNILQGQYLSYSLDAVRYANFMSLLNRVKQSGHTLTFRQSGQGSAPIVSLGTASQHSLNAMQQFWETLDAVSWPSIETHLYGTWFDFEEWKASRRQIVSLGDRTQAVDFSRIAPALSYTWQQTPKSEVIFGAPDQGTQRLPVMLLTNEGEGANDLVFTVSGSLNGRLFCNFTLTITVAPALVGLFNDMTPANNALLDETSFTISWNRILNAQYDLYLWDSLNPPATQPILSQTNDLHYATSGFCRFGHTYKWVVVARNEAQRVVSDTMTFSIRALPDLHVSAVNCTEAQAEGKLTVNWEVRNDGKGHTGAQNWTDRVWLVMDVYEGTVLAGTKPYLLAEVENVKALDVGESYTRTKEVTLPKGVYGDVYIVVTTDMYNLQNIEWNAIGGAVVNPYQPSTSGEGYRYLYAQTNASYNHIYEENETPSRSDNFFYLKLQLAPPPTPDLQVTNIIAEPLSLDEYCYSDGTADIWAEFRPTPLTNANLGYPKVWYSGKRIKVVATIANQGTAAIANKTWRNGLWLANSADKNEADMLFIATRSITNKSLAPGESTPVTFYAEIPYEWSGNSVFHVMTDIDETIEERANTPNNWWQTDTIVIYRTPGANFVPSFLNVPNRLVSGQEFTIGYNVQNMGPGVPYVNSWKDKIWISTSPDGLDNRAKCIATIDRTGWFELIAPPLGPNAHFKAELFHYTGDRYSVTKTISASDLPSGKYYIYLQVDAENAVDETQEGENNNILRSDSVRFVEPDLEITSFSISRDTLTTGDQVALTWKVRNVGEADLINSHTIDKLYATINQDGSSATLVSTIENDMTIPAGGEKTLRANISIPKISGLDGVQYMFLDVNCGHTVKESHYGNNTSSLVQKVCVYSEEERTPQVVGPAISLGDINVPNDWYTDSTGTIIFRINNIGDKRIEQDITKEIGLSTSTRSIFDNAISVQILSVEGTTAGLRPGASVMITVHYRVPENILGGSYFCDILCDRSNTIHSKNIEGNGRRNRVFVHGKLPDPIISMVTLSDTLYTSTPEMLRFKWKNIGTWQNESFSTSIYLSKSVSFNYRDKTNELLTSLSCPALLPEEETEQTYSLNILDKLAGKWYLHIIPVWGDQRIFLSDSAKTYSRGVVIDLSAVPDLTVSSVQTAAIWEAGESAQIEYTIQNSSDIATRQSRWADDFWLSPSSKLDTKNATKLGARTHSGSLNANQSYNATATYSVPSNLHGNYILYVRTDVGNAIVEEDEDNNYKAVPIFIRDANDRPADLVVTNISVPDIIYAGEPVSISYTISNQGEFMAEGNLRDIFYLSEDGIWDAQDNMVGVVSGTIRLTPGQQVTRTATGIVGSTTSGTYHLIVRTNSARSIAESNFDNNVISTSSPLQLDFRQLEVGSQKNVNTTAMMKIVVQDGNNQSILIRLSHPIGTAAGLYVAKDAVPSTARNGWHSARLKTNKQEVVLSNLKAGTYYILAQDNGASKLPDEYIFNLSGWQQPQGAQMTIKAESVNFGATSLDLTQGGNGGWVTTNINGALFDSIMDFRLVSNSRTLPAEIVSWDGGTQSSVTFNLTEAEEGVYHLVSERSDGLTGVMQNAFEVVEGRSFDLGISLDLPTAVRAGVQYFPFTFTYVNGGTTDVELSEMRLVIDNGEVALSVEDLLTNPQQTLIYKPHGETNARGYITIPPGEQNIVNVYCRPYVGNRITVAVYILK